MTAHARTCHHCRQRERFIAALMTFALVAAIAIVWIVSKLGAES